MHPSVTPPTVSREQAVEAAKRTQERTGCLTPHDCGNSDCIMSAYILQFVERFAEKILYSPPEQMASVKQEYADELIDTAKTVANAMKEFDEQEPPLAWWKYRAELFARAILSRPGIDEGRQGDDGEAIDPAFIASVFDHPLDPMNFAVDEEWWSDMTVKVTFSTNAETVIPLKRKVKIGGVTRGQFRQLLSALDIALPGIPRGKAGE